MRWRYASTMRATDVSALSRSAQTVSTRMCATRVPALSTKSTMPIAVPLDRACTIGIPLTVVVTSEWVWPLTIRSGRLVRARARSTTSPWHPRSRSQKAPACATTMTKSGCAARAAAMAASSRIAPESKANAATLDGRVVEGVSSVL